MMSPRSRFIRTAFFFLWAVVSIYHRAQGATLSGSFTNVATGSNVNLTAIGTVDWVHWGLYTATSIERKSGVAQQISDYTVVGPSNFFLTSYQGTGNSNSCSWIDGFPTTAVSNTTEFVWAYGSGIGAGFEFTVPADTNLKTLKVFVGSFAAHGRLEASLSDGSASTYLNTSLNNFGNGPGGVYTINFAAASAGQTLTIKWTLLTRSDSTGNVTLQAATLSASGANNPPLVNITTPTNNAVFTAPVSITIDATATDLGGAVAKVEFFDGAIKLGEDTNSPYSVTWNNPLPGSYTVTARASDNGGAARFSTPVEIFVIGKGGTLAGSGTAPPASINLTTEGIADWAHWGLSSLEIYDHKGGVAPAISDFTHLGSSPVTPYQSNVVAYSWTDGTPTATAAGTDTGIYFTGFTNGFELTAPADMTPRRLRVYVSVYGAQGNFQAFLSDDSAPPFIDTSLDNVFGDSYAAYTLDYAAAAASQTLTVRFRIRTIYDHDFGNVTLQAATLVVNPGSNAPPTPVTILNPTRAGTDFFFSFASQAGRTYEAQYTDAPGSGVWNLLTTLTGNGLTVNVTNRNVSFAQRFYRVESK
jgi:hypothetical protein